MAELNNKNIIMKTETSLNHKTPPIANLLLGEGWLDANFNLPDELETVFISNGNGWTSIGCRVYVRDYGWCWAESNGVIYQDKKVIVAECEIEDLDVKYWHKLPKPPFA